MSLRGEWVVTNDGDALVRFWTSMVVWPGTPSWLSMEGAHNLLDNVRDAGGDPNYITLIERTLEFAEGALDDEVDREGTFTLTT